MKMKSAFRDDYYEDIIRSDEPKLREQMDDLESELLTHIKVMEDAGGEFVPGDKANRIHRFIENVESEYDAMVKDTKIFTERV
jgi:hypothetical protein